MGDFWALLFRFSFGLLGHSFILYLMTDRKYTRKTTALVWFGVFAVLSLAIVPCVWFIKNINILFMVEPICAVAGYCLVYVLLSRGNLWRNLFVFFAYASLLMFAIVLSSCISQMFFHGSHWAMTAGRTVFMGVYALWLLVKQPARRLQTQPWDSETDWRSLAVFSVFSCCTIYISALTFMILKVEPPIRLGVSAVLFLLIGSAYWVSGRTVLLMSRDREIRDVEAQRKLLESQLTTEREFVNQSQAHRHDLRQHIRLLNDYLERGDIEGAKTYLSQYESDLGADALTVYCDNTVANALLSYTARRCAAAGVPFTCQAVIPQKMPLTGPELATVLGNILENAWEASRHSEAPWICVTTKRKGASLLLEVENAVSGTVQLDADLPVSPKPTGGLGLKSVRCVVDKHRGLLRCHQTGDTFTTQVVLFLE